MSKKNKDLQKLEKEWKKTKQNIIDIFNEEDDLEKYFKEYDQMREDKK
jgi:hypothetical protein